MVEIIFTVVITAICICGIASFIRLQMFYNFMRCELDDVFVNRAVGDRTRTYPNVDASYKNLKWWDMWNYDFKSIVVYDKD